MTVEIWLSDKAGADWKGLKAFLQKMANRAGMGHIRYGPSAASKLYMTRLRKELQAYQRTGNAEHLYNIAVYCWLETETPEHKKHHFDGSARSVTREGL